MSRTMVMTAKLAAILGEALPGAVTVAPG